MTATVLPRAAPVEPPSVAWPALAGLAGLAGGVFLLLLAVAGGYGYSRDELYFLRSGAEPAWGYADNPPLTPLIAALTDAFLPGSLVALRLPSALTAAAVVVLTGLIARELGGGRAAQALAAGCMAVSAILFAVGHLLTTTAVDLLAWTALSLLLVRALRDGEPVWLAVGAVAGVALQKQAAPSAAAGSGRGRHARRGTEDGAALPLAVARRAARAGGVGAAPGLAGGQRLAAVGALACDRGGGSGTSEPWHLFVPFQLVLISPLLVPVWAGGWVRLARDPALRRYRAFAVGYVLLLLLFVATSGKPYYLAGLYPVLLAAGAEPTVAWARRGAARLRQALLAAALGLSLGASALLFLPLVPVQQLADTPIPEINYDAGETVGWPELAATVRAARAELPASEEVAVLTRNYGQAGAVDRFAPELGPAASGHNAYWTWGPPRDEATALVVVGFEADQLQQWFGEVELAARVDNGVGLDNDEQGTPVWVARDPVRPWVELWPELRRLG